MQKIKNQDVLLQDDPIGKKMFLDHLTYCWTMLNRFGKENFKIIHNSFYQTVKDLPSEKIDRAFKFYIKSNSNFPTPSDIRKIVKDLDYSLTPHEEKFRIMHNRARNKNMGIFFQGEEELEAYETKYGKIDTTKSWAETYDEVFNN